jgi:phosphotransferase system enzyme I (PtsI)
MLCLYGKGVARGYAIGRAVVLSATALQVVHCRVAENEVKREAERLKQTLL